MGNTKIAVELDASNYKPTWATSRSAANPTTGVIWLAAPELVEVACGRLDDGSSDELLMVEVELAVLEDPMFVVSLADVVELAGAVVGATELPEITLLTPSGVKPTHTALSEFESVGSVSLKLVHSRHLVQIVSLAMRKKELVEKRSRYAIPTV
ncbi:hypothetical protein Q9L58_008017 [Maublancomyces gigas]|uniref:Uncharacterized protein n=1 Tax=Discina gigas TaxID=1032678 RepID=A0ABR3GBN1_9PEZI